MIIIREETMEMVEGSQIKIIFHKQNWQSLVINWIQGVKMLWKPLIIFSLDYY